MTAGAGMVRAASYLFTLRTRPRPVTRILVALGLVAAAAAVAVSAAVFAPGSSPGPEVSEAAPQASPERDLAGPPEPAEILSAADIESPSVPPQIAESVNDFAFDFYRNVSDTDENVFFSPVSVYTAFSVLYEGARGETAEQMLGVFGLEPDGAERHSASAHMMAALNAEDPHAVLEIANALWLADWFSPYEQYLDIARQTYLATAETVDFAGEDPPGVKKVNDWAAEKTSGKIQEVLDYRDVNNLTTAVITNAVYFKGTWLVQFPEEDTREGKFWKGEDGIDADFMHVQGSFDYAETGDAQILRMPYEGDRLSMLAVLPGEAGGLENLELSAGKMLEYAGMLEPREVLVSLPKFEIKTNYDLKRSLKEMGMPDAFDEKLADLSGLADLALLPGNLYVEKATHDAYVKVNEEGTEAAAVTTAVIQAVSQPPHFNANHPFLFTIYDEQSGLILFMGSISDPAA